MAIESTAINDLIAGFQQRPLQRDSNDWLFGERDDATEIDSGSEEKATTPFDRSTPPVVPLPQAFVHQPAPALEALYRSPSPTAYVRPISASGVAKKLALPIGVLS
ncbi:MAG TPA: hypothetical protein VFV99_22015, partial [Kofleriaceae bacterium]|nr:hypothetical protein [Kofleriaceae bacterium]